MGSKISKVGPSSYETDPPICASMPLLGKRIYTQDPTKKIDMAFPLWLWGGTCNFARDPPTTSPTSSKGRRLPTSEELFEFGVPGGHCIALI